MTGRQREHVTDVSLVIILRVELYWTHMFISNSPHIKTHVSSASSVTAKDDAVICPVSATTDSLKSDRAECPSQLKKSSDLEIVILSPQ